MLANIRLQDRLVQVDLGKPLDLSIPVQDEGGVNAWYVERARIKPHKEGDFTGSVSAGNAVNFRDVSFNPHAHGTHTETVGHILATDHPVHHVLPRFFYRARLITVTPLEEGEDRFISPEQLQAALTNPVPEALVIRTLPNPESKKEKEYAHTNWPFLTPASARLLADQGVNHVLIDTPSVDKEKDDGALGAHKEFWGTEHRLREHATITEFIYVPDEVTDGDYLLELQLAPFVNDAAPSRPVLYAYVHE